MFLDLLKHNIENTLKAHHRFEFKVKTERSKNVIFSEQPFSQETIDGLCRIPGLQSVDLVNRCSLNINEIYEAALNEIKNQKANVKTFRVTAHRSYKQFPMPSPKIAEKVGEYILEHQPELQVKLKNFDCEIHVRILPSGAFIFSQTQKGVGGLPVGFAGHLICLLSGGFDSPVASYLLSRRGVDQSFVFFYSYPFVGEPTKNKVLDLVKVLCQYQRRSPLWIIPFGEIQKKIASCSRENYRTLFFRAFMFQCAQKLAERIEASGIITGDALSQVSSQTLGNLNLQKQAITLPIYQPLIGFNKNEIIDWAKQIGTHEISVRPHDDACALFAPTFPVTNANVGYWRSFVERHNFEPEINEAIATAEVYYINKRKEVLKFSGLDYLENKISPVTLAQFYSYSSTFPS